MEDELDWEVSCPLCDWEGGVNDADQDDEIPHNESILNHLYCPICGAKAHC